MKIVHFSWEYPPVLYGGLGTFVSEVTLKMAAWKHDVAVFSLNRDNSFTPMDLTHGVEIYRPKTLDLTSTFYLCADHELRSWGPYFKFFADVLSYNIMSANQLTNGLVCKNGRTFDIIDGHDWLGIMGGIIAKKQLHIPLIFHVHSTEVGRSIGRGSHTIKDIEYEGGQQADRIITVSNAMEDELLKLGFPPEKIRVCWNGVDPDKYDPQRVTNDQREDLRRRYGIQPHETMVFFIGRLVSVKGVDKLVQAMPAIIHEFPNVKLVILGVGDLEPNLRSMAEHLGIARHVIFRTEFISEEERIQHYAAADLVVLPSLYEPFGIVCTEAMSMAKTVVVGARGTNGMREQIIPTGEEQCGFHVNPYSPEDIAWGMKQALSLPDKGKAMGEYGRRRVLKEFTWDTVTKRTLEIYQECLGSEHGG